MSLLGRLLFTIPTRTPDDLGPATVEDVLVPDPRASSDPGELIHLLVYNDPEAPAPSYPPGWTLFARRRDVQRCWSESLAAHGAGALAGPRIAKAVAVRVLAGRGLIVEGWADHHPPELAVTYRAVLVASAPGVGATADPARRDPAPRGSWLRAGRRGRARRI